MINDLVSLAVEEKDGETEKFLQWFVKEQMEEEATPAGILKELEGEGEEKVDNKLGKRVFNVS